MKQHLNPYLRIIKVTVLKEGEENGYILSPKSDFWAISKPEVTITPASHRRLIRRRLLAQLSAPSPPKEMRKKKPKNSPSSKPPKSSSSSPSTTPAPPMFLSTVVELVSVILI
ncbi:hypothetical protein Bca52824_004300 [Brassica carinata]|uniref:Uncharacterized protein n=1 Tax=Brassica carinata TaxID=52824 RepID=A0A8X7WQD2_BRACI|nr:hypothetical protein Bca52824_004300 [Brassica carinata]